MRTGLMRGRLIRVVLALAGVGLLVGAASSASAQTCNHPAGAITVELLGDVNGSGQRNVADAMCGILCALAEATSQPLSSVPCLAGNGVYADVSCDGSIDLTDVQSVIYLALDLGLPAGLNPGGDGCPGACAACNDPGMKSCLINEQCVPEDQRAGADLCQICSPDADPSGWTVQTPTTYYRDDDEDTYGVLSDTSALCAPVAPHTTNTDGDCNDADATINPDAAESCDEFDNDCDGDTDEDFADKGQVCDGDDSDECTNGTYTCRGDGAGVECVNESVEDIIESCNGLDDDCDGLVPANESDADNDLQRICEGDCNDGDSATYTGAAELCDNKDNDCDSSTDEDFADLGDACDGADADSCTDGVMVCNAGETATECNDSGPDLVEICGNLLDDDCDGTPDDGCTIHRNCSDILLDAPSASSGVYTIDPNGGSTSDAFDTYCDMDRDGGGWTLVLQNVSAVPSVGSNPTYAQSTTGVTVRGGTLTNDLSTFDILVGVSYWASIGTVARVEVGSTPGVPTNQALYDNLSLDSGNNYALYMSGETVTLGGTSPGLFTNHGAGHYQWSAVDADHDTGGTNCADVYGNPWWYEHCWSGSFWGSENATGHNPNPYWTGSSPGGDYAWGAIWLRAEYSRSCHEILARSPSSPNGSYTIDPDGPGGNAPFSVYCDMTTEGGGWTLVRRREQSTTWHPVNDNATGATGYGTYVPDPQSPTSFSLAYGTYAYSEMMFATGDLAKWVRTDRAEIDLGSSVGCDSASVVNASHLSASPYVANWCMRPGQPEDPWVSALNHSDVASGEYIVYGENSYPAHEQYLSTRNGANVWVRGFARSCAGVMQHNPSAATGMYWIDPDGLGGNAPFTAYCDMTTDGGGWTLVFRTAGTNFTDDTAVDVPPTPAKTHAKFASSVIDQISGNEAAGASYELRLAGPTTSTLMRASEPFYVSMNTSDVLIEYDCDRNGVYEAARLWHDWTTDRGTAEGASWIRDWVYPESSICIAQNGGNVMQWWSGTSTTPGTAGGNDGPIVATAGSYSHKGDVSVWVRTGCTSDDDCGGGESCVTGICTSVGTAANPASSCQAILAAYPSLPSGTYWIDPDGAGGLAPFQLFCDMVTHGGGWAYVARGSNASTQANGAHGSVSYDPGMTGVWHFSAAAIQAISGGPPYETLVRIGVNGSDWTTAPAVEQNEVRIRLESQDFTFEAPMFDYSGWNGAAWVHAPNVGLASDRGPSWEPGTGNYCCEYDFAGAVSNCRLAPLNQEGQWSNLNTNQHLRCEADTNLHDGLVIFVRRATAGSAANPASSCAALLAAYPGVPSDTYWLDPDGAGGDAPFQAYCDMTHHGGGWTLVATVSSSNANHWGGTGGVNQAAGTLPVPFEGTQAGRRMSDSAVRSLATEGVIRVEIARNQARPGGGADYRYATFFRMASGMSTFSWDNQGGPGAQRIFTSHTYPFAWEEDGGGDGYEFGCTTVYKVFDNHNSDCTPSIWTSSAYPDERILYGYTSGPTGFGIYGGPNAINPNTDANPGYTWVR